MGVEDRWKMMPPEPTLAPLNLEREEHWRHFDDSVDAVSFGFVATAILISMFLVMAIFERFLRPRSSVSSTEASRMDLEAHVVFHGKFDYPSPKIPVYAEGVSVLMPGDEIPSFIAHPAPAPCHPEGVVWPLHQHSPCFGLTSTSFSNFV